MFDIGPSELLLCAVVALVVIGPKDLPRVMRMVGQWVGRARGMARHFRSGIDTMIREAELEEMQKRWADENARIMAEHPMLPDPDAPDGQQHLDDSPPTPQAPMTPHATMTADHGHADDVSAYADSGDQASEPASAGDANAREIKP